MPWQGIPFLLPCSIDGNKKFSLNLSNLETLLSFRIDSLICFFVGRSCAQRCKLYQTGYPVIYSNKHQAFCNIFVTFVEFLQNSLHFIDFLADISLLSLIPNIKNALRFIHLNAFLYIF